MTYRTGFGTGLDKHKVWTDNTENVNKLPLQFSLGITSYLGVDFFFQSVWPHPYIFIHAQGIIYTTLYFLWLDFLWVLKNSYVNDPPYGNIHDLYSYVPSIMNHTWNLQAKKDLYCRIPLIGLIQNRQIQGTKAGRKMELFLNGSRGVFNLVKIWYRG